MPLSIGTVMKILFRKNLQQHNKGASFKLLSILISLILIIPLFSFLICDGTLAGDARELAKEAYLQIEANVFKPSELHSAIEKLKKAKQINPNEAYIRLGESLAVLVNGFEGGDWYESKTFKAGTVDLSLKIANEAISLDPQLGQTYAHLARLYIVKKRFEEAATNIRRAKELDIHSFYPWYFEGILFEKMVDIQNANASFNKAESYIAYKHQRLILNLHRQRIAKLENNPAKEEASLKENIANNPDDPWVYGNYAHFLKRMKRYDESIVQWENALKHGRDRYAEEQLIETKRLRNSTK